VTARRKAVGFSSSRGELRARRLVVFDLDGTLVDSSRDLAAGVNAMVARLWPETPPLSLEAVQSYIGNGAHTLVSRVLQHIGRGSDVEQALPVFLEEYRKRLLDTTRLYPGMRELLDRLQGRRLAVLTNKPGDMSRALLAGLEIAPLFFRIYGGGDLPMRKPDPGGLHRLMSEATVGAHETVLVGDSAIDVRTARAAGVAAVGVAWGFDAPSLGTDPPDVLVTTVADLAENLLTS
jgi:phosphoglycolate phosphatase